MKTDIILHRYDASTHFKELHEMFLNREDYGDFFRRVPRDMNCQQVSEVEKMTNSVFFAAYYKDTLVGFVMMANVEMYGMSAQIGVCLKKEYWDKKILDKKMAFLVTTEMLNFVFKGTNLNKVRLRILSKREDLKKSLEKGGYKLEGEFEDEIRYNGIWESEVEFAMTRKTYEEKYLCLS